MVANSETSQRLEIKMLVLEVIKENYKKPELYEPDATEKNFQRYVEQHSEERAKGYMEAMLDFQEQIDLILQDKYERGIHTHSDARVTRSMWLLFEAQKKFLNTPVASQVLKSIERTPE